MNRLPDQAEVHRCSASENPEERKKAARDLKASFRYFPDKKKAWDDLIRLVGDEDISVKWRAADALGSVFLDAYDKELAWKDLHRLTLDSDSEVRRIAAGSLKLAFNQVPDKHQAWQDLHRLIQDSNSEVRRAATDSLRLAFSQVPDKHQAWQDLHRLIQDSNSEIRKAAAESIRLAFDQVPDKKQAWDNLILLTKDNEKDIRLLSYDALGRASIYKASTADNIEDFRTCLEDAIVFFSKSSEEAGSANYSAFCLPFYKSIYSLLFKETSEYEEIKEYLQEAKHASKKSDNRLALLEAVANLAEALKTVKSYTLEDIMKGKFNLKIYLVYCHKAAECLDSVRDDAPFASKMVDAVMVEKSMPLLDKKIKALFKEIEESARRLCMRTKGTELEAFSKDISECANGLNNADSLIATDRFLEEITSLLKEHSDQLPTETQANIKVLANSDGTANLEQRLQTLKLILVSSLSKRVDIPEGYEEILNRLRNLEYGFSNLNLSSGLARKNLFELKNELDRIQKITEAKGLNNGAMNMISNENESVEIYRLEKIREILLHDVKNYIQVQSSNKDTESILLKLRELEQSKEASLSGILSDISSLAGLAIFATTNRGISIVGDGNVILGSGKHKRNLLRE